MFMRPDIIDRTKSSSHPLAAGRIYTGIVKSVTPQGVISVFIQELGSTYEKIVPLNTNPSNICAVGDHVKCLFTDEFFKELVVLGSARIKTESPLGGAVINIDGGDPASIYGGIDSINAGGVS